jgi:methylmalonyl-CoA mutase
MATHRVTFAFSSKIALPKYKAWGDILRWCLQENVQENFRLLQVYIRLSVKEKILLECLLEGGPERTNKRFHYVVQDCQQNVVNGF